MFKAARLFALLGAFAVSAIATAPAAQATERKMLGWGRIFTNDVIGDGYDRWRTGSYTVSAAYGPAWEGTAPARFGQLLEFRLRSELIAPANLVRPRASDRRFAGALSFGVHSYADFGATQVRGGLDITLTGPQNGLAELQNSIHTAVGLPATQVRANQIPDNVYATLSGELAREIRLGRARLRPFVELQAGVESLARVGAELTLGSLGEGALMARDITTGHRYQVIRSGTDRGLSFVVGGDIAKVFSSAYLPEADGYQLTDSRTRLRAGMNWQGESHGLFYGVSYLSEEFKAQPEGQLVGALQLRLFF